MLVLVCVFLATGRPFGSSIADRIEFINVLCLIGCWYAVGFCSLLVVGWKMVGCCLAGWLTVAGSLLVDC